MAQAQDRPLTAEEITNLNLPGDMPAEDRAAYIAAVTRARNFGERQANEPIPQNGIVVLYSDTCPHCQHSLANTHMATASSNGTPVRWVDVDLAKGGDTFRSLSGLQTVPNPDGKGAHYEIGGTTINGVPTTVWMENGVATKVLKVGVLAAGDLDMLVATQAARAPAQGTGTTIPNNRPVEPATAVQR